ncbi:2-amino-4-hydroxy-6-hydroxymethyldihydropteridine pyrophosphokinase [Novipirellula aureliae]|uniref:2-amino-4-hydroxy-6-hydroxymethyldihydropteridine pyrophosphokinase n=1 Tax=Novipirellula aureliae TaxID=2527966 RepID=A0A5C6E705_9BACT|nr:2-amino-4-hydroxy-6-hydroxymethyldihydropteridine diphosphokinase [Novipirellula aureliae]TWU43441.1 2-amino-4-hydroxy-6-hydroxymethyldihydropteridine pyrophosphokinase [Novipirellula aureliae]
MDVPSHTCRSERPTERPVAQCLVSFGSNLGHRKTVIAEAARQIADSPFAQSFAASRLFETPPIGGPDGQEPFLNAAAAFETTASAREILTLLQSVEEQLGRQRLQRWSARSIDLDVILHGQLIGFQSALIVPHPRYTARQFVLQPACDVAEHYCDPRFGWTIGQLARHLSAGHPSISLVGSDHATRRLLCKRLAVEHGIPTFGVSDKIDGPRTPPSGSWVSESPPPLPENRTIESTSDGSLPRLIARVSRTTAKTRWPAPHLIWPSTTRWPEYRLEIDDLDWAVKELSSAIDSMRCPVRPVSSDGLWY